MDIIARSWEWVLDFIYAARYSPLHSLIFRFGLWYLLSLLLFTLTWNKGYKSAFINVLIFYVVTTTVFSLDFTLLRRLGSQAYIFLLIAAAVASLRLPEKLAFYLSPYAGMQVNIAIGFKWFFWGLLAIQAFVCWWQG